MKRNLLKLLLAAAVLTALFALALPALAATDVCPSSNDGKHDWKYFNFADCTSGGSAYYQCTKCHAVKDEKWVDALGHSWSEWKVRKAATCTENGTSYHTCTRCKKSETKTVKATGHSYEWKETKKATCGTAGSRQQVCKMCGAKGKTETIKATGQHTYEWKVTKKATCGEVGSRQQVCKVCGAKGKKETIRPTGKHTWEWRRVTEPTCGAEGKERLFCSVCGMGGQSRAISATGKHKWEWNTVKKATCGTDGSRQQVCSVCGEKGKTETIKARGRHQWSSWRTTSPATCEEKGEQFRSCRICKRKQTKTIPALGHDWDTGVVTTTPGVHVPGVITYTCKRDPSHKKTQEIYSKPIVIKNEVTDDWLWSDDAYHIASGYQTVQLAMQVSGGVEPYYVMWIHDGSNVAIEIDKKAGRITFPAKLAGEYTLRVQDDEKQVAYATVKVEDIGPASLTVTEQPQGGRLLWGQRINLHTAVADAMGEVQYSIYKDSKPYGSTKNKAASAADRLTFEANLHEVGDYYILIMDEAGNWAATNTVQLYDYTVPHGPDEIPLVIVSQPQSGFLYRDGKTPNDKISMTVEGGTGTMTYVLYGASGGENRVYTYTTMNSTDPDRFSCSFNANSPTDYYILVMDEDGRWAVSDTVEFRYK